MAEFPHIVAAIESTPWAMTADAVRALKRAAGHDLSASDYSLFHGADKMKLEAVSAVLGERASETSLFSFVRDGVGALQINGPIIPRADAFSDVSGITSIDRLSREFVQLSARADVDTILLVIDSPGGAITGIAEFASMVHASAKPVVAYAYGYAASAAYWIASAARKLYVGETSMVGSIGVVMTVFGGENSDEVEIVSSQSPDKRPDVNTDAGRATLQATVDNLGAAFVKRVAANRGVDEKTVLEKFGRGGMVMPEKAQSVGMIDGQMTLIDFFAKKVSNQVDFPSTTREDGRDGDGTPLEEKNMSEKTLATMTLDEILKDSPSAKAEFDERIEASQTAGEKTAREKLEKDFELRSEKANKILGSDAYPQALKDVAMQVLAGKASVERLSDMQLMFDALKAKSDIDTAKTESAVAPKTPGQQTPALSTDGVIRSAADIDAAAAAMRAGR